MESAPTAVSSLRGEAGLEGGATWNFGDGILSPVNESLERLLPLFEVLRARHPPGSQLAQLVAVDSERRLVED